MKVKIVKCSVPSFWYHDRIGEVFYNVTCSNSGYYVMYWETKREPNGSSKFDQMCIAKQDAVIVQGDYKMKKVVLEAQSDKKISFSDLIDKGVTDKEALKWFVEMFGNSSVNIITLKEGLVTRCKPDCWLQWVNRNYPPTDCETVHIDRVNDSMIYAWKGDTSIFKIHTINIESGFYASINMNNSGFYGNGKFNSLKDCIIQTIKEGNAVYEFESQKEFFQWALENS